MENNYVSSDKDLICIENTASELQVDEKVGDCPECGSTLHYTKSDKTVECPICGRTIEVEDIKSVKASVLS